MAWEWYLTGKHRFLNLLRGHRERLSCEPDVLCTEYHSKHIFVRQCSEITRELFIPFADL